MKSTLTLGRIGGVEVGVHYSWFIIAFLITISLAAQFHFTNAEWGEVTIWVAALITGVLFFAGLLAHELSHAFVARVRGLPVHRITLFLLGGMAQIEKEASDASTEFWMSIAGPIMSVVIGCGCLGMALALGWTWRGQPATPQTAVLVWLGYINLMLAAFNMIPGFPLDGGRVLRAVMWWISRNQRRSTMIAARVGQVVALLFLAGGVYRFFLGYGVGGLWISFIGWFLLQAATASYAQVTNATALNELRAADMMSRDCQTISGELNLREFVHQNVLRTGRRCFVVVDGDQMSGLITPIEIRQVAPERWGELRVRDVMLPAGRIHAISPETPAADALDIMARQDVHQLPVVQDGHLEGMLTRGHVLQVLRSRGELKAA